MQTKKDFDHICFDCNRKIKMARYLVKREKKAVDICEDCYLEGEDKD